MSMPLLTLCSGMSVDRISPTANAVSDVQHFAVFGILYPPDIINNVKRWYILYRPSKFRRSKVNMRFLVARMCKSMVTTFSD